MYIFVTNSSPCSLLTFTASVTFLSWPNLCPDRNLSSLRGFTDTAPVFSRCTTPNKNHTRQIKSVTHVENKCFLESSAPPTYHPTSCVKEKGAERSLSLKLRGATEVWWFSQTENTPEIPWTGEHNLKPKLSMTLDITYKCPIGKQSVGQMMRCCSVSFVL